jgi:hypothetical protein
VHSATGRYARTDAQWHVPVACSRPPDSNDHLSAGPTTTIVPSFEFADLEDKAVTRFPTSSDSMSESCRMVSILARNGHEIRDRADNEPRTIQQLISHLPLAASGCQVIVDRTRPVLPPRNRVRKTVMIKNPGGNGCPYKQKNNKSD